MLVDWIPLSELQDDEKIMTGRRIRLYNVGLNVENKADDYLEYMVSFVYGNEQYLQLTCLSPGEEGNIIGVLAKDLPHHYALGRELKRIMGTENTFINIYLVQ
ncbi:MAG: hypothetical protein LBK56_01120 [Gracilibacteraceae bacterium]|jgi:hypothetical protein|nr:hypothetical protein [Gracilibacteraceae bacterium]